MEVIDASAVADHIHDGNLSVGGGIHSVLSRMMQTLLIVGISQESGRSMLIFPCNTCICEDANSVMTVFLVTLWPEAWGSR